MKCQINVSIKDGLVIDLLESNGIRTSISKKNEKWESGSDIDFMVSIPLTQEELKREVAKYLQEVIFTSLNQLSYNETVIASGRDKDLDGYMEPRLVLKDFVTITARVT